MDTPSSEQLKLLPGLMRANKFTGQNFEGEMVMATTLIENIVNELTMVVVQSVMKEFQAQEMRLTMLEKAVERMEELANGLELNQKFVERTDIFSPIIEARLVAMENVLSDRPLVDKKFIDERIERLVYENFDYAVKNIIDRYDMTGKIEDTLRDFDLGVEEAVEDEIRNRTLVTEDDLIEFINDRVRLTTE